jgi:hypothetical protein
MVLGTTTVEATYQTPAPEGRQIIAQGVSPG